MSEKKQFANDIAISTRIRLARNVMGIPFPGNMSDESAEQISKNVREAMLNPALEEYRFHYIDMRDITEVQRMSLVERHLISPDLGKHPHSGVLISNDETISVMINEEDHLRIQCILQGFALHDGYVLADKIDEILQVKIDYAFSDKYGYLTSCPTNVGTAMRAGVMIHIPALVLKAQLNIVASMASKYGLTIRGIYGEGSAALGDLFQISNQNSLGLSEDEIIQNLHAVTKEIIKMERMERNELLIDSEDEIKDKVYRAYGILANAHMISTQEAMKLLSIVRMGIDLNVIDRVPAETLNHLMINIQPATLTLMYQIDSDEKTRDIFRSEYIHDVLNNPN